MFLFQANFGSVPSGVELEKIRDTLDEYLDSLKRNGQICGDFLHSVTEGKAVARPDAVSESFHSIYGLKDLKILSDLFQQKPIWIPMSDAMPDAFPPTSDSSSLYLDPEYSDGSSPLRCGDTGEPLPTYLLPIDYNERERLYFWSRESNRMVGIEFSSGDLEIPAYEQLASPGSDLAKDGRRLAALVEGALNIPVYYYLIRYYGRGEEEPKRRGADCGGNWSVKLPKEDHAFWRFPFRCDGCRLVSHLADAEAEGEDELSLAKIGEFPDGPFDHTGQFPKSSVGE